MHRWFDILYPKKYFIPAIINIQWYSLNSVACRSTVNSANAKSQIFLEQTPDYCFKMSRQLSSVFLNNIFLILLPLLAPFVSKTAKFDIILGIFREQSRWTKFSSRIDSTNRFSDLELGIPQVDSVPSLLRKILASKTLKRDPVIENSV